MISIENVNGTSYNDDISGSADNNVLRGLDGNDALKGRAGDDTLYGGNGNDVLLGGDGNDHLLGDDGNDSLKGGEGNDIIDGGNGSDTLRGNSGSDTLTGGAGADTFVFIDGDALMTTDSISDFDPLNGDKIEINGVIVWPSNPPTNVGPITQIGNDVYIKYGSDPNRNGLWLLNFDLNNWIAAENIQ